MAVKKFEAAAVESHDDYVTVIDHIGYSHAIYRETEGNIPIDGVRAGMDMTLLMDNDWVVMKWKADETLNSMNWRK